ncbi:hypothetical protein CEP53_004141 [Fusarium sp. AF-6]|nr:hypothetical protein CEP53_004141 [Fusarium sp. AF-6]
MEILGAVTSSLALGQAIGAGRHIVRLVHEIPEIQHEFQELKQDISLITAMLDDVKNGIGIWGSGPAPSTTGEMLLGRTAQRLEEINNELQHFVKHCAKESKDNTVKAKKRKWIMQSDKLQKLREKAMDAKMNLHFALSSQSRNLVCEQVNALQHQFEMFTIHISSRRPPEASLLIDSSDSSEDKETEGPESGSESEFGIVVCLAKALSIRRDLTDELRFLLNLISSSTDEAWCETRVCQAIQQGLDMSLIRQALQEEPWTINEYIAPGVAPLHVALFQPEDATEVIELLIAMGADVNMRSRQGQTPLMIAVSRGQLECIRILSRSKGTLEAKDRHGNTALHWAFICGQFEAARLLLASGAQMATRNVDGNTPLHLLSMNHIRDESVVQETLQLLLKHQGADIESRNYLGEPPVLVAAINHRLSAVRFLVNEGASLQTIDNEGFTIFHFAATCSKLHMLQFLHSLNLSGIDLNHVNIYGDTTWDLFQYVISVPLWRLGIWRRPSIDEQKAYVSLYEGIRNRTAEQDINHLEQVLHALSQQDTTTAFSLLQTLVEEKQKWTSGLDKWYRILARQVQERELDAVIGSIKDYIEELQKLIQSSAWDLPSKITPPRPVPDEDQDYDTDYESSGEDVDSDGDSNEEYVSAEGELGSDSGSDEEDDNPQP